MAFFSAGRGLWASTTRTFRHRTLLEGLPPASTIPTSTACSCRQLRSSSSNTSSNAGSKASSSKGAPGAARPSTTDSPPEQRHRYQFNPDPFTLEPSEEHRHLPLVTAEELASSRTRPRGVRMLTRDFIHDSLYNPHYGYFSRHAVLLPDHQDGPSMMQQGWDFSQINNEDDFLRAVELRYAHFEEQLLQRAGLADAGDDVEAAADSSQSKKRNPQKPPHPPRRPLLHTAEGLEYAQKAGRAALERSEQEGAEHNSDVASMVARQVWHTPTELFKPHYAHIIAQHCVDSRSSPDAPLCIYELGAGSGALAEAVLAYLEEVHPDSYARTQYNIVEISSRLAGQQRSRLRRHEAAGRLRVHRKDFLQWDTPVPDESFVIALEVLDNLAHDVVRYSTSTLQAYQCYVSIDATGDIDELYSPVEDALISRYLALHASLRPDPPLPRSLRLLPANLRASLSENLPFYPNLTPPHYLPTSSLRFLDVLKKYFPRHHLLASDFHALPDAIEGKNAPVVQTRLRGTMIPVSKYTVLQGYFDIFFPTDFPLLADMYAKVVAQSEGEGEDGTPERLGAAGIPPPPTVHTHKSFLERYPSLAQECRLADGSNPMLGWYKNASWLVAERR